MALVKCPECGFENVSDNTIACPHCGYNIASFKRKEHFVQIKHKINKILHSKSVKAIASICILLLIGICAFSSYQKSLYRDFSGEYLGNTGLNGIRGIPNVIHFNADGTGYYYENQHMYIFDYTLSSSTVKIDTHEAFLPIYTAELDVQCERTESGFFIGDIEFKKK